MIRKPVGFQLKGTGLGFSGVEGASEFGGAVALEGNAGSHFAGKHLTLRIQHIHGDVQRLLVGGKEEVSDGA